MSETHRSPAESKDAVLAEAVEQSPAGGATPASPVPMSPLRSWLPGPRSALLLILLAALLCRVVWLSIPATPVIFDEVYYVNAARVILGWKVPPNAHYAHDPPGKDPNREHPPLGKVLIAGSMRLFGDTPLGWRFVSILAGLLGMLLLYGIVVAGEGDTWLGVFAVFLFGSDNLVLVHSRIGTLDMLLVGAMLLGAWCLLRGWPLAAGAACGIATLVKLNGMYALLALFVLLGWEAIGEWRDRQAWPKESVRSAMLVAVGFLSIFAVGLWILDKMVTDYRTPWDHVRYMLDYGLTLTRPGGPANTESYPWQWLLNDVQIPYFRVDTQLLTNGHVVATRATVFFRGAMNPYIIGVAPMGVAYAVWRAWRLQDTLAMWSVSWFAATYLPFYPLSLIDQRISYIYYFLPTLPAVSVSLAQLIRRSGLPSVVQWGFLIAVCIGFIGYFPFRTIL